jgi:hypothetical protein
MRFMADTVVVIITRLTFYSGSAWQQIHIVSTYLVNKGRYSAQAAPGARGIDNGLLTAF